MIKIKLTQQSPQCYIAEYKHYRIKVFKMKIHWFGNVVDTDSEDELYTHIATTKAEVKTQIETFLNNPTKWGVILI